MSSRWRWALAALATVCLAAVLAARAPLGTDYDNPHCRLSPACDDSGPAVNALAHGRIGDFFDLQPIAGPVSLVLRAPFVRAAEALGGELLDLYRVGAFACLLVLAAVAIWLAALARRRGAPWYLQLLLLAAMVFNPLTSKVLFWGHPEDFVAAALVVGSIATAALAAPVAAGVMLGLATATKLWAGLAVLAGLGVLQSGRRRFVVAFGAVLVVLLGTMFAGDPRAFLDQLQTVRHFGAYPGTMTPASAWWQAGHILFNLTVQGQGATAHVVTDETRVLTESLAHVARISIVAITAGLSALWWSRTPAPERGRTVLGLVALIYLVRATLEPGNYSYYLLTFLLALLVWEVVILVRLPLVTAVAGLCIWLLTPLAAHTGDDAFNAVYLVLVLLGVLYLSVVVFRLRRPAWVGSFS